MTFYVFMLYHNRLNACDSMARDRNSKILQMSFLQQNNSHNYLNVVI